MEHRLSDEIIALLDSLKVEYTVVRWLEGGLEKTTIRFPGTDKYIHVRE